jgi:hypothetical protein
MKGRYEIPKPKHQIPNEFRSSISETFDDLDLETNTNVLIYVTSHPSLPLKGGGLGRG